MLAKWMTFLAVVGVGCATESTVPGDEEGDGKADGNAACTQSYVEWAEGTLKPALAAAPLTTGRSGELEAIAKKAPCRGELLGEGAVKVWRELVRETSFLPYRVQHAVAHNEFEKDGSYDLYLQRTIPSEATRVAWSTLKSARPLASADAAAMKAWLELYNEARHEVLAPVNDASFQYIENGWTLNAGESAFFEMVEDSRPQQSRDGAFGAWVENYSELMSNGTNPNLDDAFNPFDPRWGCLGDEPAPCSRDRFLERMAAIAPKAHGQADAQAWTAELESWASSAATADPSENASWMPELMRLDRVQPSTMTGMVTYRTWLEAVAGTAVNRTILDAYVLPAKPCIQEVEKSLVVGDYARFINADAPGVTQEIKAAAAPQVCGAASAS